MSRKDLLVIIKATGTALLALVGTVFGTIFTCVMQSEQEKNRTSQVATQLLSHREQTEMEFRGEMFKTLLEKLLKHDSPVTERVMTLRLFQQNFHETFNGRAFFDVLVSEARPEERKEVVGELNRLGREISRIQESVVEAGFDEKNRSFFEIKKRDTSGLGFPAFWMEEKETLTLVIWGENGEHQRNSQHALFLKLDSVKGIDAVEMRLAFDDVPDTAAFEVSYFDTPFTDNTILPDGHRFAIVLKDVNRQTHPHQAKLKVIEFPVHYILSGYRPSVEQVDKMLKKIE